MESQKDRHKKGQCTVCGKCMLSNNLKRHEQTHGDILSMTDEEVREELRERSDGEQICTHNYNNMTNGEEENIPSNRHCDEVTTVSAIPAVNKILLQLEMIHNNQKYLDKIQLGKQILTIMTENDIPEDSLSRECKEALYLYRNQMPWMNIHSVKLRSWQQQLLDYIKTPSEREVIWVIGKNGNEGKTWFQHYLETAYGYSRVVQLDLKMGTSILFHILKKRSLNSVDIFLFNSNRSSRRQQSNYFIVESIKDGRVTSVNNDVINVKTPNIVIVFSNFMPQWEKLTTDRWKAFRVENDELIIHDENKMNQKLFSCVKCEKTYSHRSNLAHKKKSCQSTILPRDEMLKSDLMQLTNKDKIKATETI